MSATVQSARLIEKQRTSKGRHYTEYSPSVRYSYEVNGRQYTSNGVFPLGTESGTREWASGIIDRFKAGMTCTAWYDPASPGDAFIVRRYVFTPPAIVLFSILFVCIFTIGLGWGVLSDLGSHAPIDLHDGRFELRPKGTLERRLRCAALISALVFGGNSGSRRLLHSRRFVAARCRLRGCCDLSRDRTAAAASGDPGFPHLANATPHVCIDTPSPKIGDTITALVAQEFRDDCERQVKIGLLCQHNRIRKVIDDDRHPSTRRNRRSTERPKRRPAGRISSVAHSGIDFAAHVLKILQAGRLVHSRDEPV